MMGTGWHMKSYQHQRNPLCLSRALRHSTLPGSEASPCTQACSSPSQTGPQGLGMSLPAWGGGKEEPLLKASRIAASQQRSCQGKDPGQGPERQSQSRHVWSSPAFRKLLSGEARMSLAPHE